MIREHLKIAIEFHGHVINTTNLLDWLPKANYPSSLSVSLITQHICLSRASGKSLNTYTRITQAHISYYINYN